jgi:hypothetical protein
LDIEEEKKRERSGEFIHSFSLAKLIRMSGA